jgi:hypothetical protein
MKVNIELMIVRFEVILSVSMKRTAFWNVILYCFEGGCYLHHQARIQHF